jgi:hypothetical protein
MKASSSYTVEQLRDKAFTAKNGVEASIMDYGRFNYVAQPGDGARLIPILGPYDLFATEWGYREFPDAKTYEQERKELAKITARQIEDRTLRFGDPSGEDPSQQTEDLGSDAIKATELGLKNIDRVAGYLVKATSKPGENYELLQEVYDQLLGQRGRELGHVINLVGGFVNTNFWYPEGKKVFDPVPAEQQKKAVQFLIENGLRMPRSLIAPDILDRLEAHGTAERIFSSQRSLLQRLISKTRLDRMSELAARTPKDAYTPSDLIKDLHAGIWSELKANPVEIDLYRRNLQRAYVELLAGFLDNPSQDSDLPALARIELAAIAAEIKNLFNSPEFRNGTGQVVKAHLFDIRTRAEHALDPIPSAPASQRSPIGLPARRGGDGAPEQV